MTRRYVLKQVKVRDANGVACVAYREVTPLSEYGKYARWLLLTAEYACLLVVVVFVIAVIVTN